MWKKPEIIKKLSAAASNRQIDPSMYIFNFNTKQGICKTLTLLEKTNLSFDQS